MTRLYKLLIISAAALMSVGCASNRVPPLSDISIPPLNASARASLGERLLMQGRGFTGEVVHVHSLRGKFVSVDNQIFCRRSSAQKKFTSFNPRAITYHNFIGGTRSRGNQVSYKNGEVCFSDIWSGCFDVNEADFTVKTNAVCSSPNAVQQIIEYNGKSGNVLNFTYREVYGNRVATPVTQNFTMDLIEGNEISYKGARLRIESATNQEIRYSVLRNFESH